MVAEVGAAGAACYLFSVPPTTEITELTRPYRLSGLISERRDAPSMKAREAGMVRRRLHNLVKGFKPEGNIRHCCCRMSRRAQRTRGRGWRYWQICRIRTRDSSDHREIVLCLALQVRARRARNRKIPGTSVSIEQSPIFISRFTHTHTKALLSGI
jgi:hypothetical protein